jgi:hypothetical protein
MLGSHEVFTAPVSASRSAAAQAMKKPATCCAMPTPPCIAPKIAAEANINCSLRNMNTVAQTNLELETDLRHAIERQEFRWCFSPL